MASASFLIYSGPVPQQPPKIPAPALTNSFISRAKASASISYTVSPWLLRLGIPALGLAITGIVTTLEMAAISPAIWSGPVEQLAPTAHAPSFSSVIAAVAGSVPNSVLPSGSKVRVAITGRLQVSFAAISAALVSCRLIIVSTTRISTPSSESSFTCSL